MADDDDEYGPPLPPGFSQEDDSDESYESETKEPSSSKQIIGPWCPPSVLKRKHGKRLSDEESCSVVQPVIGPSLPTVTKDQIDEDVMFGPMPDSRPCDENMDDVIDRIENRAKKMKKHLDGTDITIEKPQREEWMTTPNTSSRNQLGAISRCLSDGKSKPSPSEVTLTNPSSYQGQEDDCPDTQAYESRHKKSKHQKSLLELHQKSLKKKKKKEREKHKGSSKLPERKPFDRDAELSVRMMNKDQVNSVIDKSKYLNSRFSAGASKFL